MLEVSCLWRNLQLFLQMHLWNPNGFCCGEIWFISWFPGKASETQQGLHKTSILFQPNKENLQKALCTTSAVKNVCWQYFHQVVCSLCSMICDEDTVATFCVRVTFEQWNHFNGKLWAWSIKKQPCKMVFGIYCMFDLANSYQLRQESNSLLAPPHLPVPKHKGWKKWVRCARKC